MSGGAELLDIEWLAMKAGLKPANRITVEPDRAVEVEERVRREGFVVERGARVIEFPGRPPSMILYVSPDAERARDLVEVEEPLLPPAGRGLRLDETVLLHAALGQMLGFPICCVDEFCVRLRRGITRRRNGREAHEDFVAAEWAAAASRRFRGRLNDLAVDRRARIITFYPCRYDCPNAADYAAAVFAVAEQASPPAAKVLRAALLSRVSIDSKGRRGANDHGDETITLQFEQF